MALVMLLITCLPLVSQVSSLPAAGLTITTLSLFFSFPPPLALLLLPLLLVLPNDDDGDDDDDEEEDGEQEAFDDP